MERGEQSWLHWAGRGLVDLAFPPLCLECRGPVADPHGLCSDCWSKMHFIDGPICAVCGLPFEVDAGEGTLCGACIARPPDYDRARAILRYDEHSKGAVLAIKHADRLDLVPAFARGLERVGRELFPEVDLLVPVPLHRWRLWRRRYNQAAELARALSQRTAITAASQVLVRVKSTPSQGEMPSAEARRLNVRGAFRVPRDRRAAVRGKMILLVDDVLTTGATASAAARALKRAGAARVDVVALARVVRSQADTL